MNRGQTIISNPVYESPVFLENIHAKESVVVNQGGTWCFSGCTLVVTKKGSKRIDQIKKGDIVKCFNESTKVVEWKEVNDCFRFKNQKKTVKVKLKNGKQIIATEDHEFYYEGGWYSLKHLLSLQDGKMDKNKRV